jgi:hypothetical protein
MSGRRASPEAAAILAAAAVLASAVSGAAQDTAAPYAAPLWDFSGSVESTLSGVFGAEDAEEDFSYGAEQYANLRLKADAGERGTVYAAVNLVSYSGNAALAAAAADPAVVGERYAGDLELERLYYRIEGERADAEAGLLRLAFGYGLAWSPVDFLSPANPLIPGARPRGVLGATVRAYPADMARLSAFALGGRDPTETDGGGAVAGAAADLHGERASVQGLCAYEAPTDAAARGVHYGGLSAKLEAGAGFVLDALYRWDPEKDADEAGLQASAGADYSFLDGDLYALVQYLFNGSGGPDTGDRSGLRDGRSYVYGALSYKFGDYTTGTASCVASLDDPSWAPRLELAHEPFQGLSVSLACSAPIGAGELGPDATGARAIVEAKAKLRF